MKKVLMFVVVGLEGQICPLDQLANFLLQETLFSSDIYKWYLPVIQAVGGNIMEPDCVRIFQFPNEFAQWEAVWTVFTLSQTKVTHILSVETLECFFLLQFLFYFKPLSEQTQL